MISAAEVEYKGAVKQNDGLCSVIAAQAVYCFRELVVSSASFHSCPYIVMYPTGIISVAMLPPDASISCLFLLRYAEKKCMIKFI